MSSTFDRLMKEVNAKRDRRRHSDREFAKIVGKRVYDLDANTIATDQSDDDGKETK